MRLSISIRFDRPAMQDPRDAAQALRDLASRLETVDCLESLPLNIKDRDGNSVGECHFCLTRKP